MKKVLKGKVYCTETAKEVARIENGCIFTVGLESCFVKRQGNKLFTVENPNMDNAGGILLSDGKECNLTLLYNVDKLYFTKYAWNHMESLEMSLYLTAFPIQKNIVLHD